MASTLKIRGSNPSDKEKLQKTFEKMDPESIKRLAHIVGNYYRSTSQRLD